MLRCDSLLEVSEINPRLEARQAVAREAVWRRDETPSDAGRLVFPFPRIRRKDAR
jgi:hypothetical protein